MDNGQGSGFFRRPQGAGRGRAEGVPIRWQGLFGTQDLPGKGDDCLNAAKDQILALL
jgi:hypothetical protein